MKKIFYLMLIAGMISGCQEEEGIIPGVKGRLCVDIGLNISVKEADNRLKSAESAEDLKVCIYHSDGREALVFETVLAMPDTIELDPGYYYVCAGSENDQPAAFENPFYFGSSEVFQVKSDNTQTVILNCDLANTIVSVEYTDLVKNSFYDYRTIVSNSLDSLVFLKDETRYGYFRTMSLDVRVELFFLNPDGTDNIKILQGSIPDAMSDRHYGILVNTGISAGGASIQVYLDDSESITEIIPIGDLEDTTGIPEDTTGIPEDTEIKYGDILITEIMADPSSLSDTEGEWFEIYNNSGRNLNLQNMVIQRDAVNRHVISAPVELAPGEYLVLARTLNATGVASSYIYGSSITLPNTGASLEIYSEDGVDGSGVLIFSLNYGDGSFPYIPGRSICLDGAITDPVRAADGNNWCTSTTVFLTGDRGTPSAVNDLCMK